MKIIKKINKFIDNILHSLTKLITFLFIIGIISLILEFLSITIAKKIIINDNINIINITDNDNFNNKISTNIINIINYYKNIHNGVINANNIKYRNYSKYKNHSCDIIISNKYENLKNIFNKDKLTIIDYINDINNNNITINLLDLNYIIEIETKNNNKYYLGICKDNKIAKFKILNILTQIINNIKE